MINYWPELSFLLITEKRNLCNDILIKLHNFWHLFPNEKLLLLTKFKMLFQKRFIIILFSIFLANLISSSHTYNTFEFKDGNNSNRFDDLYTFEDNTILLVKALDHRLEFRLIRKIEDQKFKSFSIDIESSFYYDAILPLTTNYILVL